MTPMLLRIKALDQTKTAFKSVKAGLAGVTSSVLNMRNALVLVAGATGFGYLVKQSLNASDQLAKTASKIGTTTDALSRLHHASNLSGVSTDTMNMALQRFVRRTAEASKGTGEAVSALRELGINATDIQRLPLDKRMMVLSDAFANVSSQSDKLRLAFKLFDSEGAGLINMLNNGSGALGDMFSEAEDLGLVLQQMSADGVERANDSIYKLTSIARGLFRQFTASLAPAIEYVSNTLRAILVDAGKTAGGFKSLGDYLATEFIDSLIKGITFFEDAVNGISKGVGNLVTLYKTLTFGYTDQEKQNKALLNQRVEIGKLLLAYQQYENTGKQSSTNVVRAFSDATDALAGTGIELPKINDADFVNKLRQIQISLMEVSDDAGYSAPFQINLRGIVDALQNAKGEIGDFNLGDFAPRQDAIENISQFKQTIDSVLESMPTLEDSFKSFTKGAMNSFTQGFTDAVTGAKNFGDAMKDMAKSVVDSLIKMLVQFYITQPLFNAIAGLGGGGGFQAGASSNSAMNFQGFDGMTGTVAYGGSVSAGQPVKVGENGEELFIPRTNGAVVSNSDLNGGSGVVINQTINLSTGVAQTVKAEVMNMMPQIAKQTKSAVMDARMRGGSFSKSLVGA